MGNRDIRELTLDEMSRCSGGWIPGMPQENILMGPSYREQLRPNACVKCQRAAVHVYLDNVLIRIDCPVCGSYHP